MEKSTEIIDTIYHKKQAEFNGVSSDYFRVNSYFFGVGVTVDGEKYEILWKLNHKKQSKSLEHIGLVHLKQWRTKLRLKDEFAMNFKQCNAHFFTIIICLKQLIGVILFLINLKKEFFTKKNQI